MSFPGFWLCRRPESCPMTLQQAEVANPSISGSVWKRGKLKGVWWKAWARFHDLWQAVVFRRKQITHHCRKLPGSKLIWKCLGLQIASLQNSLFKMEACLFDCLLLIEEYFEVIKYQQLFTEKERPFYARKFKSMNNCMRKLNLHNSLTVQYVFSK